MNCPLPLQTEVLTPRVSEYKLLWKQGCCSYSKVEVILEQSEFLMTVALVRGEEMWMYKRRMTYDTTEAQTGVLQL